MTTRPSVGRQPPPRSVSSTGVASRPPPRRTLSQQLLSSSPTRRSNEGFIDLTLDGDVTPGRPRIGTSRLRVEISKDSNNGGALESPRYPPDATIAFKPMLPPRGRPQLHFHIPSVNYLSSSPAQEAIQDDPPPKPMPLPVRPGQSAPPTPSRLRTASGSTARKDVRPKPYVLEVPTAAPRYYPDGHADFFPWTGAHPEDQFSESIIRQGYYDKAQMTQNETGSARPSIFPALKQKSGLQILSNLFTTVLAQRRAHGQVTAASTFKPPPRVTVTDTKREMWLKDLANPTISLRRLSRSIPHGIRGKVLLEQSLSKSIPTERAVWLAKCVGANELRSFRRKGVTGTFAMGGEAKWIRDFTVCVEQFVESIIGGCGEKDFRTRVDYVLRLATHFYSEYLLDREHYMDWIVASLENSPQAKLPLWLLIAQVYWKDLLRYRKYGRRLSSAIMNQFAETLEHPDHDILAPLSTRLIVLLKGLMLSNADSFVASKTWLKRRETILSQIGPEDEDIRLALAKIDRRNSQLAALSRGKKPSARQHLIRLLDGILSDATRSETIDTLWQLDADKGMLLQVLLEWATSSHRAGHAKIYLAVRIIRSWTELNITDSLLRLLDSNALLYSCDKASFYHVVSELARSNHFSTSTYIQWLIARGGIWDPADVAPAGPCATRLLAEVPLHNINISMENLRTTLLVRANASFQEESRIIAHCIEIMKHKLLSTQVSSSQDSTTYSGSTAELDLILPSTSRTVKSQLGLWLRQQIRLQSIQARVPQLDGWDASLSTTGTSSITPTEFNIVRHYLELIGDYSMLADVLKLVTTSNDPDVLASCTDTLDLHLMVFSAIGASQIVFDVLVCRLRSLIEELDSVPRNFLVSLLDVSARLPEQTLVTQQLMQELATSDKKTAVDACSPVSDHMAVVETGDMDFNDEIEKILASGNSIDRATLGRLFQRVVLHLEASWTKPIIHQLKCTQLLGRLRIFESEHFDVLMKKWLTQTLQMQRPQSIDRIVVPLITLGCLSLHQLACICRSIDEEHATDSSKLLDTSPRILDILFGSPDFLNMMTVEEAYRFRVKQSHMQRDFPAEILFALSGALLAGSTDIHLLFQIQKNTELLQNLVVTSTSIVIDCLVKPVVKGGNAEALSTIQKILGGLLSGDGSTEEVDIQRLFDLADDLTLPFCQVNLAIMFGIRDAMLSTNDDRSQGGLEAFENAIEQALNSGKTAWASILPLLDVSVARHLRQRAESQFLALCPSARSSILEVSHVAEANLPRAENLLYVVGASAHCTNSKIEVDSSVNTAANLAATLNNIWVIISSSKPLRVKDLILERWLPLLLSFTAIQIINYDATKMGLEIRGKASLVLSAIFLQLSALSSSTPQIATIREQTYDLALQLVDGLSEDMRVYCVRNLREVASNTSISYLFSAPLNHTEWLRVHQKDKATAPIGTVDKSLEKDRLAPFSLRRWEMLGEPTPNVGENDTSPSLTLFGARRG